MKIKWSGSKESNLYNKGFYASICKVITCITSFVLFTFVVLYHMKVFNFGAEDSEFTKILHGNCSHCPESWMFPPSNVLCKVKIVMYHVMTTIFNIIIHFNGFKLTILNYIITKID